jgi:hypothetical protein
MGQDGFTNRAFHLIFQFGNAFYHSSGDFIIIELQSDIAVLLADVKAIFPDFAFLAFGNGCTFIADVDD